MRRYTVAPERLCNAPSFYLQMDPNTDDDIEEGGRASDSVVIAEISPDFGTYTETELVSRMAQLEEQPELAKRACEELHRRHARMLHAWCLQNRARTFKDSA